MAKGKRIPIKKAKEISEDFNYEKVIIIGINETDEDVQFAIATYGDNTVSCESAKFLGQKYLKRCLEEHYDVEVDYYEGEKK